MTQRLKKLLMGLAALAALAVGGSALANAAQGGGSTPPAASGTQTADTPEPGDKPDGNEQGEHADGNQQGEHADGNEPSDQVTGADAQKAKDAAIAATSGGKVNEVSAEHADGGKADTPEPGDTPDPAYASQIAYSVEVAKTDGSVVDVQLDKAFKVLGTEKGDGERGHQD
jgi:hypothetical protein